MSSTVGLWSDDPLLGEVVELVLARHGVRVVQGLDAALSLHVRRDAIEIRRDGVTSGTLGRPFWEHELVGAVTGVGAPPASPWRLGWCALVALLDRSGR